MQSGLPQQRRSPPLASVAKKQSSTTEEASARLSNQPLRTTSPKPQASVLLRSQRQSASLVRTSMRLVGDEWQRHQDRGEGANPAVEQLPSRAATVTRFLALLSCQRLLHRWTQGGDCIKCFCVRCSLRSAMLNTREPSRTCSRGWGTRSINLGFLDWFTIPDIAAL